MGSNAGAAISQKVAKWRWYKVFDQQDLLAGYLMELLCVDAELFHTSRPSSGLQPARRRASVCRPSGRFRYRPRHHSRFTNILPASGNAANILPFSPVRRHRRRFVGNGRGFCIVFAPAAPELW
jgi:hypothetical protein